MLDPWAESVCGKQKGSRDGRNVLIMGLDNPVEAFKQKLRVTWMRPKSSFSENIPSAGFY